MSKIYTTTGGEEPLTLEELLLEHAEFSQVAFPESTAEDGLKKLRQELYELHQAIMYDDGVPEELADCFLCLFYVAARMGYDGADVASEIQKKIGVNKQRKWKRNEDGTYSHLKTENNI